MANGGAGQGPWRPLALLAVVLVALYATMFGTGNTKPRLAIDLAGGTSAVFAASPAPGSTSIPPGAMGTAVSIMNERVNAFGVSEAQVSQQGSNTIQVEIPGHNSQTLIDQVGKMALLYFRPVIQEAAANAKPNPSPAASGSASPGASPGATPSAKAPASATPNASSSASVKPSGQAEKLSTVKDAAGASASPAASSSAAHTSSAAPSASAKPSATSSADAAAAASANKAAAAFASLDCTNKTAADAAAKAAADAQPSDYVAACDKDLVGKYLLGPSQVSGIDVKSANATPVMAGQTITSKWQINLTFNAKGSSEFATATQQLYQQYSSKSGSGAFAIVLDGVVESAPVVNQGAITGGQAQITGSFSQSEADNLATILNYGALPLKFSPSQISIVSPTLGGHELSGGLLAGAVGLALVFLYVIFYYRGLAAVAISSLVIAALLTYSSAVLLGPLMSFTLSLAGVAGLIVAIGITADSFVVFFERLRDEVREGRTLRTAVEHGWTRARRTIIASDFVSFLAAAVLYWRTIGSVKGFAFTLGLTTVIDIIVVFLFTKPLITLVARSEFFGSGHKWSGLDPERLGGTRATFRAGAATGGKRMTIAERRKAEQAAADDVASDETKRVDV
ncbi:protein translocase subunit SecD [Actinocrinis puniceicyclus]|uniref:Protein translocase subunit SecD n=1 Tax=Actinocrinis puniceicyclus TaxID=977794 RepID=A0A8J7WU66_9ACTN|nr:protein translocase subunit SecD [Actinocrinis puniceicyclus]MBS2965209.1 protein translocase subunit SecD [Actinocrinis puniceicyclus]